MVAPEHLMQWFERQRIKLLNPDDRDLVALCCSAAFQEIVIDLAAAEQHAAHFRRLRSSIVEHLLEESRGEFFHGRNGLFVPQETFGRHEDQRSAESALHLPAEEME